MSDYISLMQYRITRRLPSLEFSGKTIINTINPHSYIVAERDAEFKRALQESDYLLPDGIGIVYAAKVVSSATIPRITGSDLHIELLEELNRKGESCFYLGSDHKTLSKIESRLSKEFPNISYGSYSPPFKEVFSDEDSTKMIAEINAFKPSVLFVGMTAPKQEKWVYKNKEKIDANIICSVGAVFDFFGGTKKRSSNFWTNIGLEWLPRLVREPSRLWRRNFISTPLFLFEMTKHKLN